MIAILPLIILVVRLKKFLGMTSEELPHASADDIASMKSASKTAMAIFAVVTVLSFIPYGMEKLTQDQATGWSLGITVVGLFIAAFFDLKAERIKRRGAGTPPTPRDAIRWYHWVFVIVLPHIAVFWGIVNLIMRKKRSGLVLTLGSIIWFALITGIMIATVPKQ